MRGNRMEVSRAAAINFAKAWAGREARKRAVFYHLEYPNGGGAPRPYSAVLADTKDENYDCVGAVMTILGCDRVQRAPWSLYFDVELGYGYVNCDTMIKDALGAKLLFEEVKGAEVAAGDLVVFGRGLFKHGHVGFLTGDRKVVHCSPSNSRKLGHALAETGPEIFLARKDRRYLRYLHWTK